MLPDSNRTAPLESGLATNGLFPIILAAKSSTGCWLTTAYFILFLEKKIVISGNKPFSLGDLGDHRVSLGLFTILIISAGQARIKQYCRIPRD